MRKQLGKVISFTTIHYCFYCKVDKMVTARYSEYNIRVGQN